MRRLREQQKPLIEVGMKAASANLVLSPQSPLLMGATMGLVYMMDGEHQGFNFVSDFRYSPDFNEKGFPRDLWMSYATFLETMVAEIRAGVHDDFLLPVDEQQVDGVDEQQVDGTA